MKITNFLTKNKIMIIVMIIASLLRLWNLNSIPPHLTPDEAALGYNAYSILKTAKDEHGSYLPIIFKSFGDYKPGLYIYATAPFVALFGLNEWSVRLPSAISGIFIVYLLYLISKKMFKNYESLPLFIALVSATNPWLIYFSRGAWEVNLSLLLTLLGIYYFLIALEKNSKLVFSAVFFGLTLITYQGAKLSTGIVVLLLGLIYWKEFWQIERKYIYKSLIMGLFISLPIILSIFSGQTGRLSVFSIFSHPRSPEYIQLMLDEGNEQIGDINYYLYHNEPYNFLRGILGRFFNHLSGRFLFFEGDWSNPRHSSPYQGMMLLSDIVFISFGFVYILKNLNKNIKPLLFVLIWFLTASLPSILSKDQVHAVRSFNMSIPLIIISSIGLFYIVQLVKNLKFSMIYMSILIFGYVVALIYFLDSYFIHLSKHNSKLWEYGYKQIVEVVTPIQNDYQRIVVQQSFAQPYIYFLFFNKYDPLKYQQNNSYIDSEFKFDVGYVTKIDNIDFGAIDWSRNRGDHGTLFVSDILRIPPLDSNDEKQFKLIKEIKYLDNLNTAFRILEVRPK